MGLTRNSVACGQHRHALDDFIFIDSRAITCVQNRPCSCCLRPEAHIHGGAFRHLEGLLWNASANLVQMVARKAVFQTEGRPRASSCIYSRHTQALCILDSARATESHDNSEVRLLVVRETEKIVAARYGGAYSELGVLKTRVGSHAAGPARTVGVDDYS